jgi:3-hydroxyacyl-[acyl-carrier-protein] dehydratase
MRWIWIDRVVELEAGQRCVAIKNVSLAEEVLHDHFPAAAGQPAQPIMPAPLVIEGMAQTAGILVGHANDFQEKVILAKISKATFHRHAQPGTTIRHTAVIDRLDRSGAATQGQVELIDPATGRCEPMAEINLMFSHVDQNMGGLQFPEHNFVFEGALMALIRQAGGLGPCADPAAAPGP